MLLVKVAPNKGPIAHTANLRQRKPVARRNTHHTPSSYVCFLAPPLYVCFLGHRCCCCLCCWCLLLLLLSIGQQLHTVMSVRAEDERTMAALRKVCCGAPPCSREEKKEENINKISFRPYLRKRCYDGALNFP